MGTATGGQPNPYVAVLRSRPFARFWSGYTVSSLGDAMTRVALIWLVFQTTKSPAAVGILLLCYTGPVLVGGLLAGVLLDRFDRGRVMVFDNTVRGLAIGSIPLLQALDHLTLWHLYVVAGIYGFLYMISLAGTPTLIPTLVPEEHLSAANALETLCYTVSGVLGPPIAGLLISMIGAPNVLLFDAASYALFVLALLGLQPRPVLPIPTDGEERGEARDRRTYRFQEAVHLIVANRVLRATTLMYIVFNVGLGFLAVWLPVLVVHLPGGGATLYGVLLGALALGETLGAALAGSVRFSVALGTLICLTQLLSGLSLSLVLVGQALGRPLGGAGAGLLLFGVFSAPLTIWAQTLRMQIIPDALRGRTFALLRTLMQGAGPLASAAAGLALPLVGLTTMIAASALLVGGPGLAGLRVEELRHASYGAATRSSQP